MPKYAVFSGGPPPRASQRGRHHAPALPPPPPLAVGDRVAWDRHRGAVLAIHDGTAIVRNDADGRRWRVPVGELRHGP